MAQVLASSEGLIFSLGAFALARLSQQYDRYRNSRQGGSNEKRK